MEISWNASENKMKEYLSQLFSIGLDILTIVIFLLE